MIQYSIYREIHNAHFNGDNMKPDQLEEIFKLMKAYKVTNIKLDDLEITRPTEYEQPPETPQEADSDDLMYWSAPDSLT
jgi:hypothetical protein